jgi:hypothetical protein
MSASVVTGSVTELLARLDAVVDELSAVSLEECADAEVVELWRDVERCRRRLDPVEHRVIGQVQTRSLAFAHGCKSTVDLARHLLNIGAGEARGRVAAADALGERRSLSGERLAPIYPTLAAAVGSGAVSQRAALTIIRTVEKLPAEVRAEHDHAVEAVLTDFARHHDPDVLARHAAELRDRLDQDGQHRDADHRDRTRELTLRRRPDGSGTLTGGLTCETAELLQAYLGATSAPKPGPDGARDERSAAQRRHDALLAGLKTLLGSALTPESGGCRTTVTLTMDADDFATNQGTARTGYGYPVPVDLAKTWLEPEARAILVLLSKTKGIVAYSTVQRLFTEQQRLAMAARDRGCSYWGCDAPPPGPRPTTCRNGTTPTAPPSTKAHWSAAPTTAPSKPWAGPTP